MHCGLELLEGYWQIRDLGSRNGIRVNNVQVQKAWVLPETRISLAEHRFQLNYVGVGDPPADAQYDDFERSSGSDQRSFMEKLGITERDLDRSRIDAENDEPIQKRWDLLDSD